MGCVSWTTSEFSVSCRPVDGCSPGRGEWVKTVEQGAERFTGKLFAAGKVKVFA